MPRRNACASASARLSSARRDSGSRAATRASPAPRSAAFTNSPSSRTTYARCRLYESMRGPSRSKRTHRCRTSDASFSRASRPKGAAVSRPWLTSGASSPSSRTRPNVATSIVSPSITARTSTASDRCRGGATAARSETSIKCIRGLLWRGIAWVANTLVQEGGHYALGRLRLIALRSLGSNVVHVSTVGRSG